ncbi:MAG TPA: YcxB family protein [Longimicrobium sp.]|nr:YcxB family protein [Longimicrobium sp.]
MNTPVSPPAPPRELSFTLDPTFAEHLRAQKAAQAHGRGRQIRVQQLIGAGLGLPLGVAILYGRDGRLDWADWLLLAVVVGYFVSPLPNWLQVRRTRRQAGGPARVTLSERGVTVADAKGSSTLAWRNLRDVTERDGFLFFDTGADAGGFFIPERVLREAGVLERAREMIATGRTAVVDVDGADATVIDAPTATMEPDGPAVSAEFIPTLWESFAAEQHVWFRSRRGRMATGYLIGVPILLLALFRWSLGPDGVRDNLYLLIGGATLALVIIPAFDLLMKSVARLITRGRLVPLRMRIDGAGVTQEAGGTRVTTAWPAIRKVRQAGGFLLFWVDRNTAHYLPLRALDGEAEEARRIIRQHAGERAVL